MQDYKIVVLLPCYNESASIKNVVKGILAYVPDVIVVDDGSADNTSTEAEDAGAYVLRHSLNKGKGFALRTGFEYIKEHKKWDAVIVMDADGQHDPSEIPEFIRTAVREKAGIILGNRMGDALYMPWLRYWTNIVTSFAISMLVKQRIPDSQCGYRLIKAEVLRDITLTTSRFDTESEILIKAALSGYSMYSIPINTIYSNERSYIHPVKDTIRFIRLLKKFSGTSRKLIE